MNISKLFLIALILTPYSMTRAMPNFELYSADPKTPIHVQANGGIWQTLNEKHYRFPIEVPENSLLIISLSANDDKSAPTSLIFAPERALDVAKQVGSTIKKAPTFYVTAQVVSETVPGSDKPIKKVKLNPQTSHGTTNKTKSGFSLDNNVTQEMIDVIVETASSTSSEQAKEESEPAEQKVILSKNEEKEPIKTEPQMPNKIIGLRTPMTAYQHTDTPQTILNQLKKLTKCRNNKDKKAVWTEVRNYLTPAQAKELFKERDDAYVYKRLKEHYQSVADKTKSNLKKKYTLILEILTTTYKAAHP